MINYFAHVKGYSQLHLIIFNKYQKSLKVVLGNSCLITASKHTYSFPSKESKCLIHYLIQRPKQLFYLLLLE